MKIFAHIAGPSGSGKTTLGEKIKKKFPFVVIKDLDEFYRPYLDKGVNSSEMDVKEMLKKDIVKFLKENKNSIIIFTGSNTITQSNDFSDAIYYNIEADHKFFIDIDLEVVLKRRFDRHIKYMLDNLDHYFEKGKRKGKLLIDFDLWKKKIEAPYKSGYYEKHDYELLDNNEIYKRITRVLKTIKIPK